MKSNVDSERITLLVELARLQSAKKNKSVEVSQIMDDAERDFTVVRQSI